MSDPVAHPDHYKQVPGVECIQVTQHFNFNLGNAIKYIWRADHKGKPIEDLRKALMYLNHEIARRLAEDKAYETAPALFGAPPERGDTVTYQMEPEEFARVMAEWRGTARLEVSD